jgi:hypothetical protein
MYGIVHSLLDLIPRGEGAVGGGRTVLTVSSAAVQDSDHRADGCIRRMTGRAPLRSAYDFRSDDVTAGPPA